MKRKLARLQIDCMQLITKWTTMDIGNWLLVLPHDTQLVNFASNINTNTLSMIFSHDSFKEVEEFEEIPLIKMDVNGLLDLSDVLETQTAIGTFFGSAPNIIQYPSPQIQPRRGYQMTPNGKFWGATSSPLDTEAFKKEREQMNCNHEWKIYTGLNHTDTYCTKCAKIK